MASKEYDATYYLENRERIRARAKAWKIANPNRVKSVGKARYQKNRAAIIAQTSEYARHNRDIINAGCRRRYRELQKYKDKGRADVLTRRARLYGVDFNPDLHEVVARCMGICGICGVEIKGAFHFDHIIPLAKGGLHATDNLQIAHPKCNQSKGAKLQVLDANS